MIRLLNTTFLCFILTLPVFSIDFTIEDGDEDAPENVLEFEEARVYNLHFDNNIIPVEKILHTGIVVDEIPTINTPRFISLSQAQEEENLTDDDFMLGVDVNGELRFYPLSILNWHQGVNDEINGQPVFINWDPLTGQPLAINSHISGGATQFGVSGLVYRSTSLYFDYATQSLWSPIEKRAVTGPMSQYKMKTFPSFISRVSDAKDLFPDEKVLSRTTGYVRDYDTNPYGTYGTDNSMLFPVRYHDASVPRKEYVLGVTLRRGHIQRHVAFPVSSLLEWNNAKGLKFSFGHDIFPGQAPLKMTVHYLEPKGRFEVTTPQQDVEVSMTYSYWFIWSAFHPESHVVRYIGNE